MRIKEIVIDGFKSYAKRTVITGWDNQFNCITGLNGSGKSNILDAICFVLGIVTMSTVRAQNQQDLIYKRGQAGVTKASVSIVFDNSDKTKSPLDYVDVETITVTRQVVLGGTSKYLINGHRAQQAQVQQLFQEVQLNVNNPNFLIMQGQITKVVNMRPTEILGLIEEAAGTGMYEKERLKAIKEIRDRDAPLHETESLLNEEVRPKLEKLRSQKRQFLEYQQCAASTEALEKIVAISEYNFHKQRLSQLERAAEERDVNMEKLKAQLATESSRCSNLEARLAELKAQQQSQESTRLDAELQSAKEEQARTLTSYENHQQILAVTEEQRAKSAETIDNLKRRLEEYEQSVGAFEKEHAALRAEVDKQHALVEERRELLTGLRTGISTTGEKETGYAYTTKRAREHLAETKQQLVALESECDRLRSQLNDQNSDELESRLAENQARLEEIERSEQAKATELARLAETASLAHELKKSHQELKDDATRNTREIERIMARYPNLDIPFNRSGIKGRVAHVFSIPEEHRSKSLALEVCAGGGIWSLVVDNEKTGADVLKHARKRMTVLPLTRMKTQIINRNLVSQIDKSEAWLALDLLEFDESVRPALEHVFGRTVVCATSSIAERAAFQFGVRSVTLEGDVFDPRGVVSGGFQGQRSNSNSQQERGSSSIFSAVAQYQSLSQQSVEIAKKVTGIESQLKEMGNAALSTEQIRNELTLISHESQLTRSRLQDCQQQHAHIKAIEQKLSELTSSRRAEVEAAIIESEQSLQKALKDAAEFNANRDKKLEELQKEVAAAVEHEAKLTEQLEMQSNQHTQNRSELARLRADLSQEEKELLSHVANIESLTMNVNDTSDALRDLTANIADLEKQLKTETSRLAENRRDMQKIEQELMSLHTEIADMRLELQQANHSKEKQGEMIASAKASLNQVLNKWSWAPEAARAGASAQQHPQQQMSLSQTAQPIRALQFQDSTNCSDELEQLEQLRQSFGQEQRRLQSLASRVDSSVVTMIERLEADEKQLRHRIETIREDRRKLEESMETLNERRRRTIEKVWKQVSKDFGLIFGDLLPLSSCELVPLNGQPIKNGFTLRVRLGATWKDGLTELSGGQRSLVALSLILALLRYHPAPVYILDEVDAALDVHHTRNIGHIIKTRFQNAQFVVVSLKDDMFTNANRIYQTRFVDGTSTVAVLV